LYLLIRYSYLDIWTPWALSTTFCFQVHSFTVALNWKWWRGLDKLESHALILVLTLKLRSTVHQPRENPCGKGGAVMVRYMGNVYYQVEWRAVIGSKYDENYYTQTENVKQVRVACSECTCTVFCGCCDNILDWTIGDLKMLSVRKHMKTYCVMFVQWL
jgi:hypothetical protein